MKILAVAPAYPPHSMVGSWLSTAECLAHMVRRGHDVTVVTTHGNRDRYDHEGVEVYSWAGLGGGITDLICASDVILSHLGDNGHATRYAAAEGKPLVRMVHGVSPDAHDRLGVNGGPALAVYPSEAARAAVGFDGPSLVVHPPLDPAAYKVEREGNEIVLVNLCVEKGGELFWRLADALPHLGFLGVQGGYGNQIIEKRRNVAVMGHITDMTRVYRRCRILLVPSITETWGRVGIEAAVSGIPIIAHPSPGLREALGDAPLWVDRDDIDGWVAAIRSLGLPRGHQEAVRRSEARIVDYDPLPQLESFATALESLCVLSV